MKIFNKQIGLIKKTSTSKIKHITFDYSIECPGIFVHYKDKELVHNEYDSHKNALHDFLILIKRVKIK